MILLLEEFYKGCLGQSMIVQPLMLRILSSANTLRASSIAL